MFHTARDSAVFLGEMLLFLGTFVVAVYAAALLIALFLKVFRSRRALNISFVVSAVASSPFLCSLILLWPYLSWLWDMDPPSGVLLLLDAVLLCFVWTAPPVQYHFLRRKT